MTDRPSRWLLAGNEPIHCQTFTQQETANNLVENPNSLKDAQCLCLITPGFCARCESQYRMGSTDSKQKFNDRPITADSTIRPEVKDGSGEQLMIEGGGTFIIPSTDHQDLSFNESNVNTDSLKMAVTSEVTCVMTDQGQSVKQHLKVHSNTERGSDNNDTIPIDSSEKAGSQQTDEVDHNDQQHCSLTLTSESRNLENLDLPATIWSQDIKIPEVLESQTRNEIKQNKDNIIVENVSEKSTSKLVHFDTKIKMITDNFNKRLEELNTKDIPTDSTPIPSNSGFDVAPDETRRTGRVFTKRRTSSNIRRIQEAIIKEQPNNVKEKGYPDSPEHKEEGAGVAFSASSANALAVSAIKNARRQRSRSRTKQSKMKYAQLQRPYRRWLGVSTCIASDTRYIVESADAAAASGSKINKDDTLDSDDVDATTAPLALTKSGPDPGDKRSVMESEPENLKSSFPPSNENAACQVEESAILAETCLSTVTSETTDTSVNVMLDKAVACNVHKIPVKDIRSQKHPSSGQNDVSGSILKPLEKTHARSLSEGDENHETMDDYFNRKEGGLAGKAVSVATKCEFETTQSYVPEGFSKTRKGVKLLTWEVKKYGDPAMLYSETRKKSKSDKKLKTTKNKFRLTSTKPEYINVQAVRNSEGKLPGQLSYKKGQIIKQLDTGFNAPDDMFYGYYRVGKLRRKVCGIYPCSHVTPVIESNSSDSEDDIKTNSSPDNRRTRKVKKAKAAR